MSPQSTIYSVLTDPYSLVSARSAEPDPKGGGGGGGKGGFGGGYSSSGVKGGSTSFKAGSSRGSIRAERGGPYGGATTGGRAYPGRPYRGEGGNTGLFLGALSALRVPLIWTAAGTEITEIASAGDDDEDNFCPRMVSIGQLLINSTCTIGDKPAEDVYKATLKSKFDMGTAENLEQYAAYATELSHGLKSLRQTVCDGREVFSHKGGGKGHLKPSEALDRYAEYYGKPAKLPVLEYSLTDWCSQATPYDKATGFTKKQNHIAIRDGEDVCKALIIARDAPDGTFNGGVSQIFFDNTTNTMSKTPWTDKYVPELYSQIDELENSALEGINPESIQSMREKAGWLGGQDLAKRAQAQQTFATASRCDFAETGAASGQQSLLLPWVGPVVAGTAGLVAIM